MENHLLNPATKTINNDPKLQLGWLLVWDTVVVVGSYLRSQHEPCPAGAGSISLLAVNSTFKWGFKFL